MNGRSYEMIWLTARITDSSAYLLLEPQPAMNSPTISIDGHGEEEQDRRC